MTLLPFGMRWFLGAGGILLLLANPVVAQIIMFGLWTIIFVLLALQWRMVGSLIRGHWPLLLFLLFTLASTSWSVAPELSLHRSLALCGTTAFGVFIALYFDLEGQLKLLALSLGIVACLSLSAIILFPEYGVMSGAHEGAWAGVFHHKNNLGRIMALAVPVFFFVALGLRSLHFLAWAGFMVATVIVLGSDSRASMIVMCLSLAVAGVLFIAQSVGRRQRYGVLLVSTVVVAALLLGVWRYSDRILSPLGRDQTLSGRTRLWAELVEKARARPWLGYGYGAIWQEVPSAPYALQDDELASGIAGEVQRAIGGWYPMHAHNGFLDLQLELGFVGLLLFLCLLAAYAYRVAVWGLNQQLLIYLWPASYTAFFVFSNVAESSLLRENNIYWGLFVTVVFTATRVAERRGAGA